MTSLVLVINAGSSSLKFQLIDVSSRATLVKGLIERVTDQGCRFAEEALVPLNSIERANIAAIRRTERDKGCP